jgi:hypothetical protein
MKEEELQEMLASLDDPFAPPETPPFELSVLSCSNLQMVVPGPRGDELVDPSWCDEPTRIMSAEEIRSLLVQAGPHTHETQRSMTAVMPPSSRRREPEEMVSEAAVPVSGVRHG